MLVAATIVGVVATSGQAVDRTILGTKLILNDKGNRGRLHGLGQVRLHFPSST
jgi:hypothetical protein